MEFVFFPLGPIISFVLMYLVKLSVFETHRRVVYEFKTSGESIIGLEIFICLILGLTFSMVLFAFNNTFWHLPYITK